MSRKALSDLTNYDRLETKNDILKYYENQLKKIKTSLRKRQQNKENNIPLTNQDLEIAKDEIEKIIKGLKQEIEEELKQGSVSGGSTEYDIQKEAAKIIDSYFNEGSPMNQGWNEKKVLARVNLKHVHRYPEQRQKRIIHRMNREKRYKKHPVKLEENLHEVIENYEKRKSRKKGGKKRGKKEKSRKSMM